MPVANVGSKWDEGKLIFYSKVTGQELLIFDPDEEQVVIPEGSGIETEEGTFIVTEPDDVSLEVDESSGKLQVKDEGIDEDKLAASVAGDGLTGGAGDALAVVVDDSTIEINAEGELQVKGGASGSFTTADDPALTVTVVDGIITSIEEAGGGD